MRQIGFDKKFTLLVQESHLTKNTIQGQEQAAASLERAERQLRDMWGENHTGNRVASSSPEIGSGNNRILKGVLVEA
ncbi:hypothetical protein HER14_17470 [Acidithiobacillus thiooxidans]|uniref:hypothetical protein n=1 Tax=Acidithiobacillus thiooxidans TaxID=930 RepID=UPI001C06DF39|nr:hypothetical protein [Acidithiobacillus thiooxidans]MBU2752659.1 hypothetical protein [Acidithiobacillus thiooxidans]